MEEQSPEDLVGHEISTAQALIDILRQQLIEVEKLRLAASELAIPLEPKFAEAQVAATEVLAAKKQVKDDLALVATKSAQINDAQERADKVRAELDKTQTAVTQLATEAEGHKNRAKAADDAIAALLEETRAQKALAETDVANINGLHEAAKTATSTTKKLADRAEAIDKRLTEYEISLTELRRQSVEQLNTITGLLPGATSAGLAHAFDDRRKKFLDPAQRWQWLFVGSVICLVFLAVCGLNNVYKDNVILPWDDIARLWIARLPIAGALVWLALHASREAALAKRLEEDYGYKAAIAASFLGFQQQMTQIGKESPEGSPLSQLCQDTLATIGSPPGRIYDKYRLTVPPAGGLAEEIKGGEKMATASKP